MLIRELRHLAALAQQRHFGRAAAEIGLTQPALSKSIRRLEAHYEARLVERGRNGAVLTEAGEVVLRQARLAEREMALAAEQIGAGQRGETGSLTVGATISLAHRLVPAVSAPFVRDYPGVRLRIVTGLNDVLFARLRRGQLDVAISPLPRTPQAGDLVHEHLFGDEVFVVARRGHPLTQARRITPASLLGFPWVRYGQDVLSTEYLNAAFVSAGLAAPDAAIESDSADMNKQVVLQSDFLSFLPAEVLHAELAAGAIVPLRIPRLTWRRSIGITTRARGNLPPPARLYADALRVAASTRALASRRRSSRESRRESG